VLCVLACLHFKERRVGTRNQAPVPDQLQERPVPDESHSLCDGPDASAPKLSGTVECDETYIGPRRPRYKGTSKKGRGTNKQPVFCAVERNGQLRRRVIPDITPKTIKAAINEEVDRQARLMTDEFFVYKRVGEEYAAHDTVCHATKEYVVPNTDINTNTVESTHALVKRGLVGIYHNISREYLHRYLWQFDFLWNNRQLNDGERTILGVKSAEGKRLMYKDPIAEREYTRIREQKEVGEQLEPF